MILSIKTDRPDGSRFASLATRPVIRSRTNRARAGVTLLLAVMFLVGCASVPKDYPRTPSMPTPTSRSASSTTSAESVRVVFNELQSPSPTVVWLILAAFVVLCLVLSYRQLALIRVNRRLVQTNKAMEAARRADSEFLANVSHELRTPVHAILGFAALVQKRTHTAEDCKSIPASRRVYSWTKLGFSRFC